jgi:hypothetical protein
MFDTKQEKEGSFISIYVSRVASKQTSKHRGGEKNLYTKSTDIRCPSLYESYHQEND